MVSGKPFSGRRNYIRNSEWYYTRGNGETGIDTVGKREPKLMTDKLLLLYKKSSFSFPNFSLLSTCIS